MHHCAIIINYQTIFACDASKVCVEGRLRRRLRDYYTDQAVVDDDEQQIVYINGIFSPMAMAFGYIYLVQKAIRAGLNGQTNITINTVFRMQ